MADAIKLNYFDPVVDKRLYQMAEAFQGEPDKVYVFVHGSPTSVADYSNGRANPVILGPMELGQRIDAAGATRESEIVLFSCETGEGEHSFARELSQYYKLVVGATRIVHANTLARDELTLLKSHIYGEHPDGRDNPADKGKWNYYFGQDYRYCNAHPEECDPPESEKPAPTHSYKVFGRKIDIEGTELVYPKTRFKPGEASEPISPEEENERRIKASKVFSQIIRMEEPSRAELAEHGAIAYYPQLKTAFAVYDQAKQQLSCFEPAVFAKALHQVGKNVSVAIRNGTIHMLNQGIGDGFECSAPDIATEEFASELHY